MPIIGIITRSMKSDEGHPISIIYKQIEKIMLECNAVPIGITLTSDYKKILNLCDGVIFQGGDNLEEYDIEAMKYLYNINKPVLAICLGMQIMGITFSGEEINVNNHKKTLSYAHTIKINKNSKLYNIFKTDVIKVNSRHKSVLKNTNLKVVGISNDGYIEAIEDTSKRFFIGVQWHPESMIDYDIKQKNLFKYFIKTINMIK